MRPMERYSSVWDCLIETMHSEVWMLFAVVIEWNSPICPRESLCEQSLALTMLLAELHAIRRFALSLPLLLKIDGVSDLFSVDKR